MAQHNNFDGSKLAAQQAWKSANEGRAEGDLVHLRKELRKRWLMLLMKSRKELINVEIELPGQLRHYHGRAAIPIPFFIYHFEVRTIINRCGCEAKFCQVDSDTEDPSG